MGLFGGGNSKSTQNTTNTNYQVSSVDNSQTDIYTDNSQVTDIEMSGQYAGLNTQGGNFTVVDGGAFNLVGNAINGVIDLTRGTVGEMGSLADRAIGFNTNLAGDAIRYGNGLAESLAGYNATVARDSIEQSGALADSLLSFARAESEGAQNLSENTTRYALQAVDSISRSDGQQLGIESLNTQKYVFIALGLSVVGFALLRGKA